MLSFRFVPVLSAFLLLFTVAVFLPGTAQADARQWGEDGVYLRQGHHIEWQRASYRNSDGYILLAWSDTRTGDRDIYGQLIAPDGTQMWESTGKMLARTREFRQEDPEVVAANNNTWIIAWFDFREDTVGDVWAQKYDMNGDPQWSANNYTGVRVDANPAAIVEVTIRAVHDGNGGAIIAWEDLRRGDGDILAQHVDTYGNTWPNTLLVTNIENTQTGITADADGLGNMLVAWQDGRDDPTFPDIWAAKITPTGALPWNNVAVCSSPGEQRSPKLCPDGSYGCYIAWVDKRSSETVEDVYIARLDSSGQNLWAGCGVPACVDTFKQEEVRVAASLNGGVQDGVVMVWDDQRVNGGSSNPISEVYSQKYNASGAAQWQANGFKVCGDATPGGGFIRSGGRLTTDLAGGMVCAWEDLREAENLAANSDLYAARVLANGTHAWGECGVVVCDSAAMQLPGAQWGPLVRVNGNSNGVLIFWSDKRSGSQSLRYQTMNLADGSRALQPDGVEIVYGLDGNAQRPRSTPMTMGRVGVAWEDARLGPGGISLFYQVIDSTGHVELVQNGTQLAPNNTSSSTFSQQFHEVCQDGSNGFFVSFIDTRWGTKLVRVSHINAQSEIVSPDSGALVWWTPGIRDQQNAFISPDGQGGCYVAWSGYAANFWIDVYVMRLNANLQRVWQNPVRLTTTFSDDILHGIITDPTGCCLLVWQSGDLGDYNINAARVCGDGSVAWNNVLCDAPGDQDKPALFADGLGGAYFAWADGRSAQQELDIYAQHVQADGSVTWAPNGVQAISFAQNQNEPALEVDSNHNLYVVWQDFRTGTDTDIYGQKLSPSGTLLWPATGRPLCIAGGEQNEQVVATEWANGLYAVWTDGRGYYSNIYATHINESGQEADPYWRPDSGGVVTDFFHIQDAPTVASDGHGGVITAWQDYRASGKEPLINLWSQWVNDYTVSVREIPNVAVPKQHELAQNYPNPFNPTTHIRFSIPAREPVKITVFNSLGQETATLVNEVMNAGSYVLEFEAKGLPSGTYFYRLNTPSFQTVRKMALLR